MSKVVLVCKDCGAFVLRNPAQVRRDNDTGYQCKSCYLNSGGWSKGKRLTKEHREHLSMAQKGRQAWNKGLTVEDPRIKASVDKLVEGRRRHLYPSDETRRKMSLAHKGRRKTQEHCHRKRLCSNPEFVATLIQRLNLKPTKPEKRIIEICNKYFPDFKYNGDFSQGVMLNGLIPDFINVNGRKEVLEVFGDYFHGKAPRIWHHTEFGRIMAYNSLGYRCLILWEYEIKTLTDEQLVQKIKLFTS